MATLINAYFTRAKLEQMLEASDKGLAVTISVDDTANAYQQNVSVYKSQSKEEREAKAQRTYYGNGQVVWTNGTVTLAPKKDAAAPAPATATNAVDDLPF